MSAPITSPSRDGHFKSKAGKVRKRLGRPGAETHQIEHARRELATGKLLFQVTGAFSEFERAMIRQRVRAGLNAVRAKIERRGRVEVQLIKI